MDSNLTSIEDKIDARFDFNPVDSVWVLCCSFVIFTLHVGLALLEAGLISQKNHATIGMRTIVDLVMGGFSFWIFGFGLAYGKDNGTNPFIAFGDFFFDASQNDDEMGGKFVAFIFQLSFATTASTIAGGAMAERCAFLPYAIYTFFNTIIYGIAAGWVWGDHGFLNTFGAIDVAGCGPIHIIGGTAAFAGAIMLGPRLGRYDSDKAPSPSSPFMALHGCLVVWFAWLSFNAGSVYRISDDGWKYCARAAVQTMLGSFGGALIALIYTLIKNKGKVDILDFMNGLFGGLVAVTGGCIMFRSWASYVIGGIGGLLALLAAPLFDKMKVDDPVAASAIHGIAGIWGIISIGIFGEEVTVMGGNFVQNGLIFGGGWHLLGIQALTALCITAWGIISTFILLGIINIVIPIRLSEHDEFMGSDSAEHNLDLIPCNCSNRPTGQFQRNTFSVPSFLGVDNFAFNHSRPKNEYTPNANIQWSEQPTISHPTLVRNRINDSNVRDF